jgi:hypothetical protein
MANAISRLHTFLHRLYIDLNRHMVKIRISTMEGARVLQIFCFKEFSVLVIFQSFKICYVGGFVYWLIKKMVTVVFVFVTNDLGVSVNY